MAVPAQAITAISPSTVVRVTSSPINSAAQRMLITGCTSCTWLTRAIGPIASPRYQAMPKTTAVINQKAVLDEGTTAMDDLFPRDESDSHSARNHDGERASHGFSLRRGTSPQTQPFRR